MVVADGNFDKNRLPITTVVLHTTAGTLAGASQRFGTVGTKVSAHYIIDTDGALYALLEEYSVAYANGNYGMNQRAISIEHVDNGNYNGSRPDALYKTSAKLVYDICAYYSIPLDRQHVIGHREVPYPTACPDTLDVERIIRDARALAMPPKPQTSPVQQLEDQFSQCRLDRDTNYNLLISILNGLGIYVSDSMNKHEATKQAILAIRGTQGTLEACRIENGRLRTALNTGNSVTIVPPVVDAPESLTIQANPNTAIMTTDVNTLLRRLFRRGGDK